MKRIALVEDNPDNQLLMQVLLQDRYEVDAYDSGTAALEGMAVTLPDLVLLDISLPEMDGTEVLKSIRANEAMKHLPVIALTAHAMAGDREKFLAQGFNEYLSKPIVEESLLHEAIERVVQPGTST